MATTTTRGDSTQGRGTARSRGRDGKMSLGQHLLELRKRLFISALALILAAVAGWFLAPFVLDALRSPVEAIAAARTGETTLNYSNITGAFDLKLQIAVTVGVVISSPVWLYQVWAFIVPALVRKEKLYAVGFIGTAIPLFLGGCLAGWYVLPHIVEVMTGFVDTQDATIIESKVYYDFVLKLVLAVGIAFVMPVFLVLLNFVGVVSAAAIGKGWRVAILVIVLFTAIATPSADIFSMFLLAIPMIVLFFLAAGVAWLHDRRVAKRAAALDAELAAG
ncbi:sec-independent protein translocase protein TatC [Frigoribacterium sp. 2355]